MYIVHKIAVQNWFSARFSSLFNPKFEVGPINGLTAKGLHFDQILKKAEKILFKMMGNTIGLIPWLHVSTATATQLQARSRPHPPPRPPSGAAQATNPVTATAKDTVMATTTAVPTAAAAALATATATVTTAGRPAAIGKR